MFAAALNRHGVVRLLMAGGAEPNIATEVKTVARVRFDQDGNIVEDRAAPAGGGRGGPRNAPAIPPPNAEAQTKADEAADAQAAAAAAKAANEAARSDLDVLV